MQSSIKGCYPYENKGWRKVVTISLAAHEDEETEDTEEATVEE